MLLAALGNHAQQKIPTDTVKEAVTPGLITVMGGTVPGQTTDAVAVRLAQAINCKCVVDATNVPGVYAQDPRKHPELPMLPRLTHKELVDIVGPSLQPGMSAVVDPVAAQRLKESNITCCVIGGMDLENLERCLRSQEFTGTIIAD